MTVKCLRRALQEMSKIKGNIMEGMNVHIEMGVCRDEYVVCVRNDLWKKSTMGVCASEVSKQMSSLCLKDMY